MLALARTDSAELVAEPVELAAFAGEVTRSWWPEARAKQIDLGLDAPAEPVWVARPSGAAEGSLVEPAAQRDPLHARGRAGDGARGDG